MSVTLKLSDEDAKLVGLALATIGKAVVEARSLPAVRVTNATAIQASNADIEDRANRQKTLGLRLYNSPLVARHTNAEELLRLGAAFDTAVYANEAKR